VQKLARQEGKAVLAATTHIDLFEDLKPSVHIHKKFGKEIKVQYYLNEINKTCSLTEEMYVAEGSLKDYEKLAHFHYRDAKALVCSQKIFVLKRGDELCGVIVYRSSPVQTFGRKAALGRTLTIQEVNRDLTNIARVVVHPKYRTIRLGVKLVSETLPLAGKPYVETTAVMARYNHFFERAGMTKIAESKPVWAIVQGVEKLRQLGFNPVFISSEKYNVQQLRNDPGKVEAVREVFKFVSKAGGIYRKRIAAVHQAYLTHKEFCKRVDNASLEKLAKMLRILAFLTQTKVYLFWKNPKIFTQVMECD